MKTEIFYALYLIAIVTEAMSGAIMGMQRGMDRFGLAFVGMVTALGGGTIRDVLFGRHPLVWIAHPEYLLLTLGAATLASIVARHIHRLRMTFITVDAIGLAAFTILGCDIGMTVSTSPVIVVMAGVLTGIGGGCCAICFADRCRWCCDARCTRAWRALPVRCTWRCCTGGYRTAWRRPSAAWQAS